MERDFLLTWQIDMHGENPLDAAIRTLETMRDDTSIATVFTVEDHETGARVKVDLEDNSIAPADMDDFEQFKRALLERFPGFLHDSHVNGGDLVEWVGAFLPDSRSAAPETPMVYIAVRGGLIQGALSEVPVTVEVHDYDKLEDVDYDPNEDPLLSDAEWDALKSKLHTVY